MLLTIDKQWFPHVIFLQSKRENNQRKIIYEYANSERVEKTPIEFLICGEK